MIKPDRFRLAIARLQANSLISALGGEAFQLRENRPCKSAPAKFRTHKHALDLRDFLFLKAKSPGSHRQIADSSD